MAQISQIDAINGILVDESGRALPDTILRNTKETSIWLELPDTDVWPEHMGYSLSVPTYESTSAGAATWTKVRPKDDTGESISPTASDVVSAKTMQSFDIYQTALKSEKLNVNDLMGAFSCEQQLQAIYANLAQNTQDRLAGRHEDQYATIAANQIVLDGSATEGTTMSNNAATEELSNKALDRYYSRMNLTGAGRRPMDRINGRPIYTLVLGEDVSDALVDELAENLRFAGRSTEMLGPLGITGVYKSWYHAVNVQSPRYTHDGSVYHRVLPYTTTTDGELNGESYNIANPDYETAPFTDTVIFHPDVMKVRYPNPKTSGQAAGVNFEPRNYRGEWTWENIKSFLAGDEYNPLGQIGFFYGVFRLAHQPMFPKFGFRIRHLRPGYGSGS
jgi:hypothetical protein